VWGHSFLSDVEPELDKIESRLKGNTLRLYWHMVKIGKPVSINDVQKKLSLSSPGLVAYHLNKLVELGLVEKILGEYKLSENVRVGVLRSFVRLWGLMIPRYVFYAVFFTVLSSIFVLFFMKPFSIQSSFAVVACVVSAAIFWYEALRVWRGRPF